MLENPDFAIVDHIICILLNVASRRFEDHLLCSAVIVRIIYIIGDFVELIGV